MKTPFRLIAAGAIAAAFAFQAPIEPAQAAASTQTTHALMCAPVAAVQQTGARTVGGTNTAVPSGTLYSLNSSGCALILGADVGYFLSQGYTYGPSVLTLQAIGLTGSSTTAISTGFTLPAYGYIVGIVVCETAGNAVTGGLSIGDSGSSTRFIAGGNLAVAANGCSVAPDANLTRVDVQSGVPTASAVQVAPITSWNSAVVNITILYSYF